jgi:hypothetical protein
VDIIWQMNLSESLFCFSDLAVELSACMLFKQERHSFMKLSLMNYLSESSVVDRLE